MRQRMEARAVALQKKHGTGRSTASGSHGITGARKDGKQTRSRGKDEAKNGGKAWPFKRNTEMRCRLQVEVMECMEILQQETSR